MKAELLLRVMEPLTEKPSDSVCTLDASGCSVGPRKVVEGASGSSLEEVLGRERSGQGAESRP